MNATSCVYEICQLSMGTGVMLGPPTRSVMTLAYQRGASDTSLQTVYEHVFFITKRPPSEGYNAEGVFFPCGPIRHNDAVLFVRERS